VKQKPSSGLPDAKVKNPESGRKNPENPGNFPSKSGSKSGEIFSIILIR
jgi:hypothetical protein